MTTGNTAGDSGVTVDVGTLAGGGGTATIAFQVTIKDPLPAGVMTISNQGTAIGNNSASISTDDPASAANGDPTIVAVDPDLGGPPMDIRPSTRSASRCSRCCWPSERCDDWSSDSGIGRPGGDGGISLSHTEIPAGKQSLSVAWRLGAGLILLLGIGLSAPASDQQLPYFGVIDLYDEGHPEQAREAARRYFEEYREAGRVAVTRADRESAAILLTGLAGAVLAKESQLPPGQRFAGKNAFLEEIAAELEAVERLRARLALGDFFERLGDARGVQAPNLALGPPDDKSAVVAEGGMIVFEFDLMLLRTLSRPNLEVLEDERDGKDCYDIATSVAPSGPFEDLGRFCGRAVIPLGERQWIDYIRLSNPVDADQAVKIDSVRITGTIEEKAAQGDAFLDRYFADALASWLRAASALLPEARLRSFVDGDWRIQTGVR